MAIFQGNRSAESFEGRGRAAVESEVGRMRGQGGDVLEI
jgi:hypothetical protein